MKPGPRALVLLAALVAVAACDDGDPVILSLGGERVRRSDFERHVLAVEARGLGPVDPSARAGLLEAFLEQRALVIEARRKGLLAPAATAEDEPRAVARLLADGVRPAAVSEEEIAAHFRDHAGELAIPDSVTLRQVLVSTLNEARDVKRRLARDPRAFESIARSQSKAPEAAAGGYMGAFERGQLPPELEAAAFALAEGGTSDPVETSLGYHVLRVESRQQGRPTTLDEARERVRDRLAREKQREAERAFVAGVLARAKVNPEAALRASPSEPRPPRRRRRGRDHRAGGGQGERPDHHALRVPVAPDRGGPGGARRPRERRHLLAPEQRQDRPGRDRRDPAPPEGGG